MGLGYATALLVFATLVPLAHGADVPASFRVTVTGKGKPMILIPGLSCSGEVWDGAVARFKDRYQCHVLTLAGFAGVPRVPAPFLEKVRKDLAAYIRDQKLEKPVVVGHSLGGFLALSLAGAEPSLVGPLVIVDSLPFFGILQGPEMTAEKMRPMAAGMRKAMASTPQEKYGESSKPFFRSMVTRAEDLERITAWVSRSDPTAAGDAMYEMFTTDLREDCARITSPALVLGSWAAYKAQATREDVERNFRNSFAKLKGVQIALHDTALHFLMFDDADWTYRQIGAFLDPAGKPAR